ncbi:MAG TPA: methylenetetrahydrofolate--tRNA-(uracil(54)-C(5))-methyltransferase (FADH(2)-oxidizing) TrmFO, partial [Deltaproteobacteria bacterium]|nr:methylenetetrahydrofolate--tRNA-(uracil(54)-C(5))-methyltransferase (FADH(2)-oxidizing) TrmFO [Deltaproteobacteria bacterium]
MPLPRVSIIGAGLAGVEAAHVLAARGLCVDLFEMRPAVTTPAHRTDLFAELVCSNSFKGTDPLTAHGILKAEMEMLGSMVLSVAHATRVPAGKALAVDRSAFAASVTSRIMALQTVTLHRGEVTAIDPDRLTIVATGPLTSNALARHIASITGSNRLFFYDAIAPIIEASSIDMDHAFTGSRWSPADPDYLNCPLNREEYERFTAQLLAADRLRAREFEDARFFEACLPIEVLASRGIDALRYGPMRPVGLIDPKTGRRPYAVVQLRRENLRGDACTPVGFQTRLTYPEQKRVFSLIPALRDARYLRYGSIHRNTYLDAPRVLEKDLRLKGSGSTYVAGQLTGVEGYMESAATGIVAGLSVLARIRGERFVPPGPETAIGAL